MGTKIFVLHLKSIIRYGLIVLISGVVLAVILTSALRDKDRPTYSPGVYSAQIVLHSNPVNIQVEVDRHNILGVEMLNIGESEAVFYPLFEQSFEDIAQQVVALQSTQEVQLTEDNSVTGGIILQAIDAALDMAEKQ